MKISTLTNSEIAKYNRLVSGAIFKMSLEEEASEDGIATNFKATIMAKKNNTESAHFRLDLKNIESLDGEESQLLEEIMSEAEIALWQRDFKEIEIIWSPTDKMEIDEKPSEFTAKNKKKMSALIKKI